VDFNSLPATFFRWKRKGMGTRGMDDAMPSA
jgi:hypothetical protein